MILHALARKAKRRTGGMGLQVLWVEPMAGPGVWVVSTWGSNVERRELARDHLLHRALLNAARNAEPA